MPDAAALESLAAELRAKLGDDAVVAATYHLEQACIEIAPGKVFETLEYLKAAPGHEYNFLCSVHGCDYLPEAPRLGVHYELLNMRRVERLRIKTRVDFDACSASTSTVTPTCAASSCPRTTRAFRSAATSRSVASR